MGDDWVTVGSFSTLVEAEMARNRLEAEGIPTFLSDGEAINMIWAFSGALGGVKVLVSEELAGRAEAILRRIKRAPRSRHDDYGLEEGITQVPDKVSIPAESETSAAEEEEEEAKDSERDVIARRALLAAMVGLLFCPGILHVISAFTLMEIGEAKGKLTSAGRYYVLAAWVIDTLVILGIVAIAFLAFFR